MELIEDYVLLIWAMTETSSVRNEMLKQRLSFTAALELIRKFVEPVTLSLPIETQTQVKLQQST